MAAVSDFGPMGKYITLNLSRNRRAYVSYTDIIPEEFNVFCVESMNSA